MEVMILTYSPVFRRELMDVFHLVYSGKHMSSSQEDLLHYGDYLDDISDTPGFAGYVAFIEKELVGFVLGHRLRWFSESEFIVSQIAVLPEYKEKGIGRQLVEFLRKDQKEKGTTHFSATLSKHTGAYEFFLKMGMVVKSDLRTLYGDM